MPLHMVLPAKSSRSLREPSALAGSWQDVDRNAPSEWEVAELIGRGWQTFVRGLIGLKEGEDPNDVYDEMVRRRYTALIYGYECRENENKAGDDYSFEDCCDESIELRLAMLENMSWRFDW